MSQSVYHKTAVFLIIIAGLFAATQTNAQLPSVVTSVDKNNILIGEQIHYKVATSMPDNTFHLSWFNIPDSFGSFVVVSDKKIDSSYSNGNLLFSQELTITSFDSGRQVIPPLTLVAEPLDADSAFRLFTDSIPVTVSFSPLDSVKTFHDIKSIIEVKNQWPWWIWLLIGIGAILAILFAILLWRRFRKKEHKEELITSRLTPYDEAMQSLKDLEKKHLLEKNEVKEYHTLLTDIFKRYLTRKTNIFKLHLTSDEVLMEINEYGLSKEQLAGFANCLRMSNAVKFAKFVPANEESEKCLHQTKEVIKEINNYFTRKTESAI